MLTILALAAAYGACRGLHRALRSLRELPRDNDDLVFF
jgi:hypothetical protein